MSTCGYNPDIVRVCDDLWISWHCRILPRARCLCSSAPEVRSVCLVAGRVLALSDSNLEQVPVLRHQPSNTTATGDSAGRIDQMLPKREGGWPLVIYRHILQGQGQPPPKHLFSIHCNPNPLKPEKLSFTQTWGLQVLFCKNSGQQWQRRQSCWWRQAVAVLSTPLNRNFPKQYLLSPQIIRTKGIY